MRRSHFQEWILDDIAGVCKIRATRVHRKIDVRTIEGRRARQTRRMHLLSRFY